MNAPASAALAIGLVLALTGCGGGTDPAPRGPAGALVRTPPGELVRAEVERDDPDAPAEDFAAVSAANNALAVDLYGELRKGDENVFFSSLSISQALSMTYAGARGETERQMADALNFGVPQERLHPAINALDQALPGKSEAGSGSEEAEGFRLTLATPHARKQGLHITDVFHDAFVSVDEKGTEAAAATGAVIGIVSAPAVELVVDRPFLFLIRERETEAILFLGQVLEP